MPAKLSCSRNGQNGRAKKCRARGVVRVCASSLTKLDTAWRLMYTTNTFACTRTHTHTHFHSGTISTRMHFVCYCLLAAEALNLIDIVVCLYDKHKSYNKQAIRMIKWFWLHSLMPVFLAPIQLGFDVRNLSDYNNNEEWTPTKRGRKKNLSYFKSVHFLQTCTEFHKTIREVVGEQIYSVPDRMHSIRMHSICMR